MSLYASDTGQDFKRIPPGTYPAVCDMVVGLGRQETPWGVKPQVYLRWEVPSERIDYTDKEGHQVNKPMAIGATLTISLNEKATLGQWIQAWRGVPFTMDELKQFDLFRLLGAPCLITVMHSEKNGKVYANVSAVARLVKGMEAPKAEMPLIRYSEEDQGDYDKLSEWIHKKLSQQVIEKPESAPESSSVDPDDSVPF